MNPSILTTPNAKKAGKLYSIIPTNGTGDLDVVRATTATYVDADGLIKTAGINEPRFDYSNGSCPSILVEPQRTNLLLRSEEFNDNNTWIKTASSNVLSNNTISPSGNLTACKLVEGTTDSQHRINQTTTSAIGTNTFSVFAKKAERDFIWLRIGNYGAYFDLTNGDFSSISGGVTASIKSYPNGWYRCAITLTSTVANEIIRINVATSVGGITYLGDGTSGIYIWGAQLEAGSNATSYIPTTSATVTRNADVISKSGISDLIGQTEGTMFVEIDINTIEIKGILDISADIGNFYRIRTASSGQFLFRYRTGGGTETTIASLSASNSETGIFKIAFAYKNGDYASCINGVLRTSNISGISPIGLISEVSIGVNPSSLNDRVNSVIIFKERLSNEQLIQLTTL